MNIRRYAPMLFGAMLVTVVTSGCAHVDQFQFNAREDAIGPSGSSPLPSPEAKKRISNTNGLVSENTYLYYERSEDKYELSLTLVSQSDQPILVSSNSLRLVPESPSPGSPDPIKPSRVVYRTHKAITDEKAIESTGETWLSPSTDGLENNENIPIEPGEKVAVCAWFDGARFKNGDVQFTWNLENSEESHHVSLKFTHGGSHSQSFIAWFFLGGS